LGQCVLAPLEKDRLLHQHHQHMWNIYFYGWFTGLMDFLPRGHFTQWILHPMEGHFTPQMFCPMDVLPQRRFAPRTMLI